MLLLFFNINTYYVVDTALSSIYTKLLNTQKLTKYYYYPYFTNEKTEAPRYELRMLLKVLQLGNSRVSIQT